jgi:putative PEP-CTERM system histidine kinase
LSLVMTSTFERAPLDGARRDYDHWRIWLHFTRRLRLPLGADEIARELIDYAVQASGAASAAVYLADEGADGTYRLNARVGRARFTRTVEPAGGLPAWLRLASSPAFLPARLLPFVVLPTLPAALAVPIRWRMTVLGMLVLAGADLGDDDLELLATLADQAAASIQASRLAEEAAQPRRVPALDRVTSTAIHDIKNSVSALSMLVNNAAIQLSDPEFQRDAVATLARTVERMRRLLASLSSPTDARPPAGEPIDLQALIVEATAPLAAQPRIRLVRRLRPVGPVHGDREALLRAVENLTTNAVEAIDGEGTVTVVLDEAGGDAVVSVADTGCGITDEFRERRLFSPHQSTKQGGWGLGLYQTRHAVESQGGEILVESRPGQGTTFTVRLPLHAYAATTCPESV